jgi:hypothetical protein
MIQTAAKERQPKSAYTARLEAECPAHLDLRDYLKLRVEHGLQRQTILESGFYTVRDTGELRVLLGGHWVEAPAMVLPGRDAQGRPNHYNVVRLPKPIRDRKGRLLKFLMPRRPYCPYFPAFPVLWETLKNGGLLGITEGICKALAATQAGIPFIGLMGPHVWHRKRQDKKDEWELVPDFDAIDWAKLTVPLVFDTDPERKPTVNHGQMELARILTGRGAKVLVPRLPFGPRSWDGRGRPVKQAVDDYLVRFGPDAFRKWVEACAREESTWTLDDWRRASMEARTGCYDDGIYLDVSPTGSGKTWGDLARMGLGGCGGR